MSELTKEMPEPQNPYDGWPISQGMKDYLDGKITAEEYCDKQDQEINLETESMREALQYVDDLQRRALEISQRELKLRTRIEDPVSTKLKWRARRFGNTIINLFNPDNKAGDT